MLGTGFGHIPLVPSEVPWCGEKVFHIEGGSSHEVQDCVSCVVRIRVDLDKFVRSAVEHVGNGILSDMGIGGRQCDASERDHLEWDDAYYLVWFGPG